MLPVFQVVVPIYSLTRSLEVNIALYPHLQLISSIFKNFSYLGECVALFYFYFIFFRMKEYCFYFFHFLYFIYLFIIVISPNTLFFPPTLQHGDLVTYTCIHNFFSHCLFYFLFYFIFCLFFFFFPWAAPAAYGGSQARG